MNKIQQRKIESEHGKMASLSQARMTATKDKGHDASRQDIVRRIRELKDNIQDNLARIAYMHKTRPEKAASLCDLVAKQRGTLLGLTGLLEVTMNKEREKAKEVSPGPSRLHVKITPKRHKRWSDK